MILIGITSDTFFKGESSCLVSALEAGMDKCHIRKPGASKNQIEALIAQIPTCWHPYLVLHDGIELIHSYPKIGGIHLNSRTITIPTHFNGSISRSCHTITELSQFTTDNYLFLSPIFDSISKAGYNSAFSSRQLKEASANGLINDQTIALGGITPERVEYIRQFAFGGVAVLGYLWGQLEATEVSKRISKLRLKLK